MWCLGGSQVNIHYRVYLTVFGVVTNKPTQKQPADPTASLLLTIEKAVFCDDDYYNHITTLLQPYYNHMIVMIIIHQLFLLKVGVITDVTREGDRNKVSSWGSGREFIGRFIVNINLGSTEAETKAVIFHSSSLFMDPILVSKKMNTFTKLSRESSIPP